MSPVPPPHVVLAPYPGGGHTEANPGRLATIALLAGMEPAPPSSCRALEIGCGDGVNVMASAVVWPGARFVGVDIAPRAVAAARSAAADLRLANVEFHECGVADLPAGIGTFDFVTAPGVYSWVPPEDRDALMAAFARHLAPGGVAHLSFDTVPGAAVRGMLRAMLLHHVRHTAGQEARADQAFEFVKFLSGALVRGQPAAAAVAEACRAALDGTPAGLSHDHLAPVNQPFLLTDVVDHARRHGLEYLGDTDWPRSRAHELPESTHEAIGRFARCDVERQQYLDFVHLRGFRHILLRLRDAPVSGRHPSSVVPRLSVSHAIDLGARLPSVMAAEAPAPPAQDADPDVRLVGAAMDALTETAPNYLPFGELLDRAYTAAAPRTTSRDDDREILAEALFDAFEIGLVSLHAAPPPTVLRAGTRPVASPLARWQASGRETVTSFHFTGARLNDEISRSALRLLDGTRDRAAILRELAAPGVPAGVRIDEAFVETLLQGFARAGLLAS